MKRPTQSDVARLAGVSRATVSYVVNGVEANSVSEETRQRVQKAVDELGYQPDALAQSLRSGTTNTVGLLIPDLDNPHYWQIAKGVEAVVQAEDNDLLLISAALDYKRELDGIRALSRRRIDGLILILSYLDEVRDELMTLDSRSLVLMNATVEGVDAIYTHEEDGTRKVMNHLLELGHRRIGFIFGVANHTLGVVRLDTYYDVLQENRLEPIIERCGTTIEEGYTAARNLLNREDRPTALLVINDLLAMGALRAAIDLGLQVPGEVSIASFDDITFSSYVYPRLTTVGMDASRVGFVAAEMVFNRMRDPDAPPQIAHMHTHLSIRDTTGPVPDEQPQ